MYPFSSRSTSASSLFAKLFCMSVNLFSPCASKFESDLIADANESILSQFAFKAVLIEKTSFPSVLVSYLNNSNVLLKQQKNLNDYKVYRIFFDNCRCGVCGPPRYLIYKNNVVRIASSDEVTEIYFANKKTFTEPIPTKSIHEALQLYCKSE